MGDEILNFSELSLEYAEYFETIIQSFDINGEFDRKINELFQSIMNRNWIDSMIISDYLIEYVSYIKAYAFEKSIRLFHDFINRYIKFNPHYINSPNQNRPYSLNADFDDERKILAYDYFHPIVKQARLIRFAISKYTGQKIPDNIFLIEGERIKKMQNDLQQKITIQRQTLELRQQNIQIQKQMNDIILDTEKMQMSINSQNQNIISIDLPQQNSCKCELY